GAEKSRLSVGAGLRSALLIALLAALASCAVERPRAPTPQPEAHPAAGAAPALALLLTIPGEKQNGELGFRFGSPRDVDGDGIADIAAGARFTDLAFPQ